MKLDVFYRKLSTTDLWNKELRTPPKMTVDNVLVILKLAEEIFKSENQRIERVKIDCTQSDKIDIFGLMLLYKMLEFSIRRLCFKHPYCEMPDHFQYELRSKGFWEFLEVFSQYKGNFDYNKLKSYQEKNKVFIAPIVLKRESNRDEVNEIAPRIRDYYNSPLSTYIVMTFLAEIASNFKSHSVKDTISILTAEGTTDRFTMVCADTGVGIISSLRECDTSNKDDEELIKSSICRGVTSKNSDEGHMGHGLWMISEYVKAMKGDMRIISEGYMLHIHNGISRCTDCPYWSGTIIQITIPVNNNHRIIKYLNKL